MRTELWPFGEIAGKRPMITVVGYNTGIFTKAGKVIYRNKVIEDTVITDEQITEARNTGRLDTLPGIPVEVKHFRENGIDGLLELILKAYKKLK